MSITNENFVHPKECAELLLSAVQFLTDPGIYPWTNEDLKRRNKAFPSLIEQQLKAVPGSFKSSFLKPDQIVSWQLPMEKS